MENIFEEYDKFDDPLELLGHDISYDKFVEWLEIARDEVDAGLASFEAVFHQLIKYKHFDHASIVLTYINKLY